MENEKNLGLEENILRAGQSLNAFLLSRTRTVQQDLLLKIKDIISQARKANISHKFIADLVAKEVPDITKTDVLAFCVTHLGEKPQRSRKLPQKKASSSKKTETQQ